VAFSVKPDKALVKDQLQALQAALNVWGKETFLAAMIWILAKQKEVFQGQDEEEIPSILVPFRFNRIQRDLDPKLAKNNLFVKPRQVGGTTYFSLVRLLLPAITDTGIGSLLISQNNEYAEKHFRIIQRAYRYIGATDPYGSDEDNAFSISLKQHALHIATSNRRELIFDQLESRIMIASAEVEESGQGVTLQHIVASEYSRWPKNPSATLSNVRGALVPDGTTDKECTANGAGGDFYKDCMRSLNTPELSDAKIHYYSHWWQEEYQDKNLTEEQKDELEKDLTADELRLIAKIHADLNEVAWIQS
jgi:hypothetical protein